MRLDNRKILRAPGPNILSVFFCRSINYIKTFQYFLKKKFLVTKVTAAKICNLVESVKFGKVLKEKLISFGKAKNNEPTSLKADCLV